MMRALSSGISRTSRDILENSEQFNDLQKEITASQSTLPTSKLIGDISHLPPWRIRTIDFIEDERFDITLGSVITFNTALIIAETDATADGESSPLWLGSASYCLLVIYTLEIILRFVAYRCYFFKDGWNVMDLLIIGSDIVLLFLELVIGDMPKVTILRMFRLARICRTFQLLSKFRELKFFLVAFTSALTTIAWGVTLILVVVVVWSILFVQLIHPVNKDVTEDGFFERNYCERCPDAFRTVWHTLLTIFQSVVAGDSWGLLSLPVIEASPLTAVLFLCVLVTVSLAIMNLIMAVVVERALANSSMEDTPDEKKRKYMMAAAELLELCSQLDKDGSDCLSKQEIESGFDGEEFSSAMRVMGINREDLNFLFEALDSDNSGEVNFFEFVSYLLKYRDADERTLLFEIMKLNASVQQLQARRKRRYALAEACEADVREAIALLGQWLAPQEQELAIRNEARIRKHSTTLPDPESSLAKEEPPAEEQRQVTPTQILSPRVQAMPEPLLSDTFAPAAQKPSAEESVPRGQAYT